jgi:hypothetical protein
MGSEFRRWSETRSQLVFLALGELGIAHRQADKALEVGRIQQGPCAWRVDFVAVEVQLTQVSQMWRPSQRLDSFISNSVAE